MNTPTMNAQPVDPRRTARSPHVMALVMTLMTAASLWSAGCDKKPEQPEQPAQPDAKTTTQAATAQTPLQQARALTGPYSPLPKDYAHPDQTQAQEALGRMLYYDARLSKNHDVSCNSCHDLARGGVDGLPTSPGHKKQLGARNSPTVYNAAGHFKQFWDGRAADVEEQAKGPVLNPVEMAMASEEVVVSTLRSIPGYVEAFKQAFPEAQEPVTYELMARAIGAFERKLVTPSRFDAFLQGDDAALTEEELRGFIAFNTTGCVGCHHGALLGGTSFQKVGAVKPWPNDKDPGLFEVSKKEDDRMMFKAPSMRNVALTAPYFHDGSVATLEEAVRLMAAHQLGQDLDDPTLQQLVAFLKALDGQVPTDYIAKPALPESGPQTPAPDPS